MNIAALAASKSMLVWSGLNHAEQNMADEILGNLSEEVIEAFLREAMQVQEQPKFMHGANESARRDKLAKLVEEYSEKL